MKFNYWRVLLLGFGFMGVSLLWGIYNAYVPVFLQAGRPDFSATAGVTGFGMSASFTGFIMTLDNIAALFILPFVGAYSDRIWTRWGRRKPFIATGAPIALLGFIAIPLFLGQSLLLFMAAIFITLFAMDIFRTPVVSLMPDITPSPKRSQANGMINLMGGVGGVLAFAVGGLLFKVSVGAPFYFGGIAMLLGCGIVLLFIREPNPETVEPAEGEPGLIGSLKTISKDKDFSTLYFLFAIFFWFLGYNALEVFFTSFAVNELNVDSGQATFLLAYFSLAIIIFAPVCGFIGGKTGRKKAIGVGIIAFAALLTYGYTITTVLQAKIMLLLCGIAWSFILVNSLPMVVDMAPQDRLGAYTGLYYLSSQSSAIVGPILSGKIIDIFSNDYRTAFLYAAITLIIALLFLLPVKRGEALT
ncbi:MAG: MFS transporter [Deltaproteobacteria bacterium]|nr:MFS transporter [Deltaproteobacteria bacterium]